MAKWLTKSDYLKFLIHPAYLWLQKYDKDRLPPFDEAAEFMAAQGNEVEAHARTLFPGGVLVDAPLFDLADATTRLAAQAKPETALFQASVLTKRRLFASADVLVRNESNWDLYEIKSSAAVKFDHINDLAFQKTAFSEAGYDIGRSFVIHINRHYQRDGAIDAHKLLKVKDVSLDVDAILGSTSEKISEALAVIEQPNCPDDSPLAGNNVPVWLPIYRELHPELGRNSIYRLKRLNLELLRKLDQAGISEVGDIPLSFKLHPSQRAYLEALKLGHPAIHRGKIGHWLNELKFPLYFLDYETYNTAIPQWDGQKPYQQLPFQYSLHILDEIDGKLTHKEFLARGSNNPLPKLLEHLKSDLGPSGSVLVWYKDFEMGRNDSMAVLCPDFADFLVGVNGRVVDLMEVFTNLWYVDAGFGGSASIKNVLPVLVPDMNYASLGIQKGDLAQVRWTRAARGEMSATEAEQIYADLVEYCGQDTLAMVKIYQVLLSSTKRSEA